MDATVFKIWLSGAELGDELVYHCGDLAEDSDSSKGAQAAALNDLISAVLVEADRGRVKLRQEGAAKHIARRIS